MRLTSEERKERFRAIARAGRKFLTKKEEERHWDLLAMKKAGAILDVYTKPFKLRLTDRSVEGSRALTYEPDFGVVEKDGSFWCEEVKAARKAGTPIWLGDARTKVLTAARLFPCFRFRIIWRFAGKWHKEEL